MTPHGTCIKHVSWGDIFMYSDYSVDFSEVDSFFFQDFPEIIL